MKSKLPQYGDGRTSPEWFAGPVQSWALARTASWSEGPVTKGGLVGVLAGGAAAASAAALPIALSCADGLGGALGGTAAFSATGAMLSLLALNYAKSKATDAAGIAARDLKRSWDEAGLDSNRALASLVEAQKAEWVLPKGKASVGADGGRKWSRPIIESTASGPRRRCWLTSGILERTKRGPNPSFRRWKGSACRGSRLAPSSGRASWGRRSRKSPRIRPLEETLSCRR